MVTDQPKPLTQLIGIKHRALCHKLYLEPLLKGGVLAMTPLQRPNHPKQAYALTEIGIKLKARSFYQGTKCDQQNVHEKGPK